MPVFQYFDKYLREVIYKEGRNVFLCSHRGFCSRLIGFVFIGYGEPECHGWKGNRWAEMLIS